jgi:hypothetical protein
MKFVADQSGFRRFYKLAVNTSTHTGICGRRRDAAGSVIPGESAPGGQQGISAPIPRPPLMTYVVSYSRRGRYAVDQNAFNAAINNGVLHGRRTRWRRQRVYRHNAAASPDSTFMASNYWVDVVQPHGTTASRAENPLVGRLLQRVTARGSRARCPERRVRAR